MKAYLLLAIIAGNLFLGWSFTQLRLGGIPFNEIVLLICLLTTDIGLALTELSAVISITPFLVWWVYCIGRAATQVPEYGLWALRDASQALDSLILIAGFAFARDRENIERLRRWLPWLIGVTVLYGVIGHPFKTSIKAFSPSISSPNGEAVPLLGVFITTDTMLVWAAAHLFISGKTVAVSLKTLLLAGALICYAILMFQYRTTYLQLFAVGVMLMFLRPKAVMQMLSFVPLLIGVVILVEILGIKLSGRLSEISLSFFAEHLAAIFGLSDGSNAGAAAAASGVDQRMEWWKDLYRRVTADPVTLLTGLGYGFPLVPFVNVQGIQVREPHSSFMSVFSRAGLIGLSAWLWMHVEVVLAGAKCYAGSADLKHSREWRVFLLDMMMFLALILAGTIGEDNLEKPFFAIPYYFFGGVILGSGYWIMSISSAKEARILAVRRARLEQRHPGFARAKLHGASHAAMKE